MLICLSKIETIRKFKIINLFRGLISRHLCSSVTTKDVSSVSSPAVRIKKVLHKDISQVLKLLKTKFSANEPLIDGLQMTSAHYSPALQELWRNHLEQGMSLMAISQKYAPDAPIFGATINTKCCSWDSDFLIKYSGCIRCPKTRDLINLWALFMKESKIHEKFKLNSLFHINHVIINEKSCLDYSDKLDKSSLSEILVGMSLQLARSRGYDAACLTSTSQSQAEVALAMDMEPIWEYPFEKILNNDLNPIVRSGEPKTNAKMFAVKF